MTDALAGSPSLDAAMARLRQAQASIAANKAGLLPQVSADASETRQRLSEKYIIPPPYGGTSRWVGTAQANLDWSLDLAGRQKALVQQARASTDAAALDVEAARVTLSGRGRTGLYQSCPRLAAGRCRREVRRLARTADVAGADPQAHRSVE